MYASTCTYICKHFANKRQRDGLPKNCFDFYLAYLLILCEQLNTLICHYTETCCNNHLTLNATRNLKNSRYMT